MRKKIINTKTFDGHFPALMKHKSGSIFLVTKWALAHTAMCLSRGEKDEGLYGIGMILKPKELIDFEIMKTGFFIEFEVE